MTQLVGKNQTSPDVSQLADKWWMDLPEPKKLKIDEPYGLRTLETVRGVGYRIKAEG